MKRVVLCVFLLLAQLSYSQDCLDGSFNNSGLFEEKNEVVNQLICDLRDTIEVSSGTDLKLWDYHFFPVLAYVNGNEGINYNVSSIDAELSIFDGYYIAILKEHRLVDPLNPSLGTAIRYSLKTKLPKSYRNRDISDLDLIMLTAKAENAANRIYNESQQVRESDRELITTLLDNFSFLINGGSLEADLEEMDFVKINTQGQEIRISEGVDYGNNAGRTLSNCLEFAQIELRDDQTTWTSLKDIMSLIPSINVNGIDVNLSYILSATSFGSTNGANSLKEMHSLQNQNSDFMLWIHVNELGDNQFELFVGYFSVLTQADYEFIVDSEFVEKMDDFDVGIREYGLKEENNNAENRSSNGEWKLGWQALEHLSNWFPDAGDDGCTDNDTCVSPVLYGAAMGCGIVDGLLGSLKMIYDLGKGVAKAGTGIFKAANNYILDLAKTAIKEKSLMAVHNKIANDVGKAAKKIVNSVAEIWQTIVNIYQNLNIDAIKGLVTSIYKHIIDWLDTVISYTVEGGYEVGKLLFEVILNVFTAGASSGATGAKFASKFIAAFKKFDLHEVSDIFGQALGKARSAGGAIKRNLTKCKILGKGCFVKDTPVLMAGNANQFSLRNSTKAMAVAAAMPIVAVPIQEVQLLDYAVAHETVNSTYGLTASVDEDIYLGLMDKDPYTSDQQRERDEYEINDTDWNEVVFEEVNGSSIAKLALHNDWINLKRYQVDAVVEMNLPEQGISGPFRITSVKHIIPQKKPVDDDEADEYDYRPVTALFTHEASDVWRIKFDNGEELGVTHKHPIYSVTKGDWEFAGELEVGEEVLTKDGGAKVVTKELGKAQQVYNLEVKDYHNFLVNASGIVVHNTGCFNAVKELLKDFVTHKKVGGKSGAVRNGNKVDLPDGRSVPINGKEFPDLTGFTAKTSNGSPLAKKFDNLKGNNNRDFDNKAANDWLFDESGLLDDFDDVFITNNDRTKSWLKLKKNGEWKEYTWHHHENGKTMMLVEREVHSKISHVGGASLISSGATTAIDDFASLFPDPIF